MRSPSGSPSSPGRGRGAPHAGWRDRGPGTAATRARAGVRASRGHPRGVRTRPCEGPPVRVPGRRAPTRSPSVVPFKGRVFSPECRVFKMAQEAGSGPWRGAVGGAGSPGAPQAPCVRPPRPRAAPPVWRSPCPAGHCCWACALPSAGPLGGTRGGARGVRWESCPCVHRQFAAFKDHSHVPRSERGLNGEAYFARGRGKWDVSFRGGNGPPVRGGTAAGPSPWCAACPLTSVGGSRAVTCRLFTRAGRGGDVM